MVRMMSMGSTSLVMVMKRGSFSLVSMCSLGSLMKFKKGDTITPREFCKGFSNALVDGVVSKNGKKFYSLRIMRGTALIPVSAEDFYTKVKDSTCK